MTSQKILMESDWFEMLRIHAPGITAEVIDSQTFRNRANEQFVADAMCTERLRTS